jgi:ADP-dependent NAD(P)H-hydrate dehydratase / NAD(P)H-hydrate epimerase
MKIINIKAVQQILGTRELNSHKGDYGKVLLIAGSYGMAGAATLAGWGAYSAGVGLVVYSVPEQLFPILQVALPEAICIPRKTGKIDFNSYDAIIIGPGLGIHRENIGIIEEILKEYHGPLVIDADGLNCISHFDLYQNLLDTTSQVIITPHPGEAKRLLGVAEIGDREVCAVAMAQMFRVTAVLKGAGTLVASVDSTGQTLLLKNETGNPGMATAGSGDVLSGILGAFLAKGLSPYEAASAAVFIHGSAGDLAAKEKGETGLMASDICRFTPYAIRNIIGK